jgi:hypothetical protein
MTNGIIKSLISSSPIGASSFMELLGHIACFLIRDLALGLFILKPYTGLSAGPVWIRSVYDDRRIKILLRME